MSSKNNKKEVDMYVSLYKYNDWTSKSEVVIVCELNPEHDTAVRVTALSDEDDILTEVRNLKKNGYSSAKGHHKKEDGLIFLQEMSSVFNSTVGLRASKIKPGRRIQNTSPSPPANS